MKKFYAFAAVALMAFSASAQEAAEFKAGDPLYLTGQFEVEGVGTWDPEAPLQFTYADGKYTLEVTQLAKFKLSSAKGDWDAFNAAAKTAGRDLTNEDLGKAVALEAGDADMLAPYVANYTVTIDANFTTVTLATDDPEPATALFLRGDMNAWGAPEAWQLQQYNGSDDIYTFTCPAGEPILPGVGFKIADANWAKYNFGVEVEGDLVFLDVETMLAYNGQNINIDEEWDGILYFQLSTATLVMSNDKSLECPFEEGAVSTINAENGVAKYYNLQGVRVNGNEKGLVIVVKDGKAVKVVK